MELFNEYKDNLMKLLSIDTVQDKAEEGAPFGKGNKDALDFVLSLAKDMGFKTKNLDGYIGYAEIGSGKETFGILGHLDTVPIGKHWTKNPYGEISDNIVYGRGIVDDKGPILSCLYAVKEAHEKYKLKQKVRVIFGCNEESGWGCIDHYNKKEKMPSLGFSPDADFPVINYEKGIVNFELLFAIPEGIYINGGDRPNMVPSYCEAEIGGEKFETKGTSVHASHAYEGENAILKMFKKLSGKCELLKTLYDSFSDCFGGGVGLKQSDEMNGALILNLGTAKTVKSEEKINTNVSEIIESPNLLKIVLDIRYPETITEDEIRLRLQMQLNKAEINKTHFHMPLYVDKTHYLVKTLLSVYNDTMKTKLEPITIGGGTYARAMPLGVAFGPVFPDKPLPIHCPDEHMPLDQIKKMYQIYIEAVKRLCC